MQLTIFQSEEQIRSILKGIDRTNELRGFWEDFEFTKGS